MAIRSNRTTDTHHRLNRSSDEHQAGFTISAAQQGCSRGIASRFRTRFARTPDLGQAGFTIIELMIASVVFTTMLVVLTIGVIRFTNGYYRGINSSSTQTTVQAAMDTISQAAQFSSGGTASGGTGYFCAGGKEFYFKPGIQFDNTAATNYTNPGLYMFDNAASCPVPTPAMISGGTQLLGGGMRVVYASITNPSATYLSTIKLKIAYGDAELLCSPAAGGGTGGCTSGAASYGAGDAITAVDTVCKPTIGSQFCSVVEFSNTVQQRLVH